MPYLEDLLTVEERSEFEEHLRRCRDCAEELKEKRRWSSILEVNREAMCPETTEIFDYARDPNRDDSALKMHLKHCASCRADMESFVEASSERSMPEELWKRMTGASDMPRAIAESYRSLSEWLRSLMERIQDFVSVPTMALGTVAAVILVVVVLYSTERGPQHVAVLSSEPWDSVLLKRGMMGSTAPSTRPSDTKQEKKRLAELIMVRDEGGILQQAFIDELYRELEPSEKSAELFDWVTPAEIAEVSARKRLDLKKGQAMVRELRADLGVTDALLITVAFSPNDKTYAVNLELVNAEKENIVRQERLTGLRQKDLATRIGAAIDLLLEVN